MQIFLQSLADYNAGRIVGQWISLKGMNEAGLQQAIADVLIQSKEPFAEEIEIADYEGFYGLTPHLSNVLNIAGLLEKYGEAYALYAQHVGEQYATEADFEDAYCGEWSSFKDYAVELFDELYLHDIPKHVPRYIDYDGFAADLLLCDYYTEHSEAGKIHVFRSV